MIKNIFLSLLIILIVFSIIGCTKTTLSESDFSSPRATLVTFQNALKNNNYELAYECYSEEFKQQTGNTFDRFSDYMKNNPSEVDQIINAKIIEEKSEGSDIIILTDDGEGYKFSNINNQWKITGVK